MVIDSPAQTTSGVTPRLPRDPIAAYEPATYARPRLSWSAVFAGIATAVAIDIFFAQVFLGMNLGLVDRSDDAGSVVFVNALLWVVTSLAALFAGAWVAGRMARTERKFEGALHGLTVWSAGAVMMLFVALGAAGVVGGGMMAVVGNAVSSGAEVAAVAMPEWTEIRNDLRGALDARGRSTTGEGDTGAGDLAARSQLLDLARRNFTVDGPELTGPEREEFVGMLSSQLGMSRAEAEETLTQWDGVWDRTVATYEDAKAEAAAAVEDARRLGSAAASWAAVAMLIGAVVAAFAGGFGAECAVRNPDGFRRTDGHVHSGTASTANAR